MICAPAGFILRPAARRSAGPAPAADARSVRRHNSLHQMSNAVAEQEQRSRDIADTTRRYLTALNTGGVGVTFGVAGALAARGVEPRWAVWPVAIFVLGLAITGGSLLLAKHKALKRRDAAAEEAPAPGFKKWYWANFTYEILALLAFLFAVGMGLWKLNCVHLPPH